jgi:hypothetical protein
MHDANAFPPRGKAGYKEQMFLPGHENGGDLPKTGRFAPRGLERNEHPPPRVG